jgi:hypothetical protein
VPLKLFILSTRRSRCKMEEFGGWLVPVLCVFNAKLTACIPSSFGIFVYREQMSSVASMVFGGRGVGVFSINRKRSVVSLM